MPIYKNNTDDRIVETLKDSHGALISFEFEPGQSITTEYILLNANLTEVAEAPYFNPLQAATHVVTSTGVGDNQTVQINRLTKMISIYNSGSAIVDIYIRSLSNTPPLKAYPSTQRLISVGGNVDQLICVFPSEDTIYIEERK